MSAYACASKPGLSVLAMAVCLTTAMAREPAPAPEDLEEIDGYLVANAKVTLNLTTLTKLQSELYVSIENLTDESYEFMPDYPMPGASCFSGACLKL